MPAVHFQAPMQGPSRPIPDRIWRVSSVVVLVHLGLGWAISSGWLTSVPPPMPRDNVIMASVVMEAPAPPAPVPPQITPPVPKPKPRSEAPQKPSPLRPPLAVAQAVHPAPNATEPAPSATAPVVPASPAPAATAPSAPAATGNQRPSPPTPTPKSTPAQVVQPSTDADYLNNPAPPYPRISKRMGEQGTVTIRVFINTAGRAEQAEIRHSSGYTRLDESALATVKSWRFVPRQRNGVPEAMWFNVPIRFVLD